MAVERNYLADFLARIDPHRSLWRSLEFACIAARRGAEWIALVGRAELSTIPCDETSEIRRLVDLPNLRAYCARLKPSLLDHLTTNLRDLRLIRETADDDVRLDPSDLQVFSWWAKPDVDPSRRTADGWPASYRLYGNGPRIDELIPNDFWEEIDTQLLRSPPHYNGLAGLCAKLTLKVDRSTGNSYFALLASLPAKFVDVHFNRKEKSLGLTISYVGAPDLFIEWLPQRQTVKLPVPKHDVGAPSQIEVPAPAPAGSTHVEAKLLIGEFPADSSNLRIDWNNTLLRIADFFDPGHKDLEGLLSSCKQGGNLFELGIARLLGLAGFNVLWFGKASKEALPDMVAYWRGPLGKELIILAECTVKDPMKKFPELAARASDFTQSLAFDENTMIPVLFSRAKASELEHQAAHDPVVLCDGDELRRLHEKVRSDAGPEGVFESLKFLRECPSPQMRRVMRGEP